LRRLRSSDRDPSGTGAGPSDDLAAALLGVGEALTCATRRLRRPELGAEVRNQGPRRLAESLDWKYRRGYVDKQLPVVLAAAISRPRF